jgi:HEAT repeat protein
LCERLAAEKDPAVRAALAANWSAPDLVLKKLLNDEDAEVRLRAADSLRSKHPL